MSQQQYTIMTFDPQDGTQNPYPSHAGQYREWHGHTGWLYNPWTGEQRHALDVGSDPQGILILPPGEPLFASTNDNDARVQALMQECNELRIKLSYYEPVWREAVTEAAALFRKYEVHHRAKGGEADDKAEVNNRMASKLELLLENHRDPEGISNHISTSVKPKHCPAEGGKTTCLAAQVDNILCPNDSCDIETGVRDKAPMPYESKRAKKLQAVILPYLFPGDKMELVNFLHKSKSTNGEVGLTGAVFEFISDCRTTYISGLMDVTHKEVKDFVTQTLSNLKSRPLAREGDVKFCNECLKEILVAAEYLANLKEVSEVNLPRRIMLLSDNSMVASMALTRNDLYGVYQDSYHCELIVTVESMMAAHLKAVELYNTAMKSEPVPQTGQ